MRTINFILFAFVLQTDVLYALSYMIVGFASIVLWLFKSDPGICENITSFAQIFLGMIVAIVTGYFRNNTTEQNL